MKVHADTHIAHLTARDGVFYDSSNDTVELKGINHYGFNMDDKNGMFTSIWGPDTRGRNPHNNVKDVLTMDFRTIVWRMKLLGFNTVRLPFSFKVLGSSDESFTLESL